MRRLIAPALVVILATGALYWLFSTAAPQMEATQKFRKQWNADCHSAGGTIVTNGKGNPAYLCFGPDGRLLSTR